MKLSSANRVNIRNPLSVEKMAKSKQSVNEFLQRIFGLFDGSISKEEFRQTLILIQKENVNSSGVDEQVEKVDFDNDGKIDFKEFCYSFIESILDPEYNSKLKILFEKYDTDNDGNISLKELDELIEDADEETWKSKDVNRDGIIDYRGNYIRILCNYFPLIFKFSISEFLMVIFDIEADFKKWANLVKKQRRREVSHSFRRNFFSWIFVPVKKLSIKNRK